MVWGVAGRSGQVPSGPVTQEWDGWSDMRLCTAWLLWSRRMDSELSAFPNEHTVAVARERGIRLSTFAITRAENGKSHADPSMIVRYERLLGLPAACLRGPLRAAARMLPQAVGSSELLQPPEEEDNPRARSHIVSEFYERVHGGERVRSGDWLAVADALTTTDEWLVPTPVAAAWIEQLVGEMMRSVDLAYYARMEAVSTLASDPKYAMDVIRAAEKHTNAPGVSGARDAWSVVGDVTSQEAIEVLIGRLRSVPDGLVDFYSLALITPAFMKILTKAQERAIAAELTRRVRAWTLPHSYEPLAQLAAELPERLGAPILREIDAVHPLSRLTGARDGRDVQSEVDAYTRAATNATWPGHHGSALPELLRIILRNDSAGARFHATTLIRWSPFAAAICDEAVAVSLSSKEPPARQIAAVLASQLATPASEPSLRALLEGSEIPFMVNNALRGLAHSRTLNEGDDLVRYMKDERYRGMAVYAAGITGHPSINATEADSAQARWWRAQGGGLWDDVTTGA